MTVWCARANIRRSIDSRIRRRGVRVENSWNELKTFSSIRTPNIFDTLIGSFYSSSLTYRIVEADRKRLPAAPSRIAQEAACTFGGLRGEQIGSRTNMEAVQIEDRQNAKSLKQPIGKIYLILTSQISLYSCRNTTLPNANTNL